MFDFLSIFNSARRNCPIKPVVLLSLDGWGIAPDSPGNAISRAKLPSLRFYLGNFPNTTLIASGESVGLPANEVGNSEVGHLTMGAGRVIYQSLKRIDNSIADGTFLENPAFLQAIAHVNKYHSRLHIMGLVGASNVHSSLDHVNALLGLCQRHSMTNAGFHFFTDGRDSPPHEAVSLLQKVDKKIQNSGVGRIASIAGRYYAMDRDGLWDRTQKAYELLVSGHGSVAKTAQQAISTAYSKGVSDEFIEPTLIVPESKDPILISDNDAVVYFNFRADRAKQLTMAFTIENFEKGEVSEFMFQNKQAKNKVETSFKQPFIRSKKLINLFFVTMTEYQKKLPVSAIAFPLTQLDETLSEVISGSNLKQLHLAESEKETMVGYYFDGLRENPFPGEDRIIIPSKGVRIYDKKPEMSIYFIVSAFKNNLHKCHYHFFMINFANPDMVAHTGNTEATIKALEHTDKAIGMIANEILRSDGTVFITADHGNAEQLLTYSSQSFFFTTDTGAINTYHSNHPVPFVAVNNGLLHSNKQLSAGSLSDVAPTILHAMNLPVPSVMTGRNLLE